jgi:DNA helicase HerA-like ATPase
VRAGKALSGANTMTSITLALATSLDDLSPVSVTPEQVFGRHCAIVGSSGGGKSWSLARLIEQANLHRAKIVLFDASGEFDGLSNDTFHVHLGDPSRELVNSHAATLPYFELSENDLLTLFQPSDAVQWVKLRAAIKTLKLLQVCPALGTSGTFAKTHKHKAAFEEALELHRPQLERPDSIFNIHKLPTQIDLECVLPVRSHSESDHWGGISISEQSACIPLINRIEDLLKIPELRPLFNPPPRPSAFEAIEKFLSDPGVCTLRISLEFLPAAHQIRTIATDAISRHLLSLARTGHLKGHPVVIAVDEAHQVTSLPLYTPGSILPPSALESIAKEGRKYGLTLCLATQRPADIPEALLSQVGAFIVHRLVGPSDLSAVETAAGGMEQHTLALLPRLAPGEALLLGIGSREPRRVKMLPPIRIPKSHGPDYQQTWRKRNVPAE